MQTVSTSKTKPASFLRGFVDHPASVGETYFGHMAFAARFSSKLFMAGGAAIVHALIPPLFETTASRIISDLYLQMETRHQKAGNQ